MGTGRLPRPARVNEDNACGNSARRAADGSVMSTFGPFYSRILQRAINHAERLADELARALDDVLVASSFDPWTPSAAEVWLIGRAEEVEAVVADVVLDRQTGRLTDEEAAAEIQHYVDHLIAGLARHVRTRSPLHYCGLRDRDDRVTRLAGHDAETRVPF